MQSRFDSTATRRTHASARKQRTKPVIQMIVGLRSDGRKMQSNELEKQNRDVLGRFVRELGSASSRVPGWT
jgi:hypothetical protein